MEKQVINQENQNQMKNKNNSEARTNGAVRKLLASSALSAAIISWIATAQGLRIYVFSYYWQAAIISAAIQGTLFAFSIKAIPLMKKLRITGRIAMVILWICILLSSSIFSYVYISKSVYSNKLLQKDSNRIMVTKYLEIYNYLDDIIEINKDKLEGEMEEYIAYLANDDGSIEISDKDKEEFNDIITNIQKYSEDDIIPSPSIIDFLNKIQTGTYSENDIQTLKEILENDIDSKNNQINDVNKEIEEKSSQIIQKEERLKTFSNITSDEYQKVSEDLEILQTEKDNRNDFLKKLREYIDELKQCLIKVDYIERGLERKLYHETLEMRKYLNQDKIDTDALIKTVENIYNDLFNYNVSSNDPRLSGYKNFKNNVVHYAVLVDNEEVISEDREKVYALIIVDNKDDNESEEIESEEIEDKQIYYSWEEISSNLQNVLKDIPQTYFDEFILSFENENQKYLSQNEIIELIMDMDRLYLSDLNDFERAWTLLWSDIHIYKTLLLFSVIFAFGMDLFSFGTGLLLYFMDREQEIDDKCNQVNLRKWVSFITKRFNYKN